MPTNITFPAAYWDIWDSDATFVAGDSILTDVNAEPWAVLVFVFYGDNVALADIEGRGMCIPSGKIEPGETLDEAATREVFEEIGATIPMDRRRLIGWYRLIPRSGAHAGALRLCPVFVAEALGFEPIPLESESRGVFFAAIEDVADVYFFWNPLIAAVFQYADDKRREYFPPGMPVSALDYDGAQGQSD